MVVSCIKALYIVLGVKAKQSDTKMMIARFSRETHVLQQLKNYDQHAVSLFGWEKVARIVHDKAHVPKPGDGVFCKHITTWLKAACWLDEIVMICNP